MPGAEGGRLPLEIRRARAGEEEAVLIPCTRPSPVPPGGRADLVDEAARARAAWLREGISAGVLRVMVAWVPAPTDACIDYPGYGPVPTEALSHGGHVPAGLVEYAPASHAAAPVKGEDVWVIHCVWVIPPYAGRGIGAELVAEVLRDLRRDPGPRLCSGLAVVAYEGERWWGFFDYMPSRFFRELGFAPVDRDGNRVLLYFPLDRDRPPPYLIPPRTRLEDAGRAPDARPAKRSVKLVYHSRCPAATLVRDSLAAHFARRGDVGFEAVDSRDREVLLRYGVADGVYVDGRLVLHKVPSVAEVLRAASA